MSASIRLRAAGGLKDEEADELAGIIEAARGEKASEWIAKQLAEIQRDPNVRTPASVLRKRVEFGAHLRENDPPPRPQDHNAGAGIREQNTRAAEDRRATDADYERRRVLAMLNGDGRSVEDVAEECWLSVAEVRQIAYGARSPAEAPEPRGSGDRPSRGIQGVRELVAQNKAKQHAQTA